RFRRGPEQAFGPEHVDRAIVRERPRLDEARAVDDGRAVPERAVDFARRTRRTRRAHRGRREVAGDHVDGKLVQPGPPQGSAAGESADAPAFGKESVRDVPADE